MFVDFLNLKKSTSYLSPLFEYTTKKVKKRKKVPLTLIEKPLKSPKTPKKQSTARWRVPSLRNCRISRAGAVHRSGIAESHALEASTAQESQNLTRGASPTPRSRRIPRAGWLHRSRIPY